MELVKSYPNVRHELTRIALEAGVLSNMVDSIRNVFPSLLSKLSSSFEVTNDIPVIEIKYTANQKFVTDNLHTKQYLDLANLMVHIPEGFNGKLAAYAATLHNVACGASTIVEDVLKPYSVYLSQFISNKDAKISTKDHTSIYKGLADKRDLDIAAMDHYRSDGTISQVKLGSIITRKEDIVSLYNYTSKVSNTFDTESIIL